MGSTRLPPASPGTPARIDLASPARRLVPVGPSRLTVGEVRLVSGCALGLATGFAGLFFSTLAIFLKPIAAGFHWTRAEASAGFIMSMLGLAIGAAAQGWMIDRFGPRAVITGAIVSLAACLLALSAVPASLPLFAALCLVLGASTCATGPNGYLTLLPPVFDRRLGLALSCAMIGVGIGSATLPALAERMVLADGWRHAYAMLVVLCGGAVALLLIGKVAHPGAVDPDPGTGRPAGMSRGEAIRDWRLWLMALAMALVGGAALGIAFHTAAMLDDRGFSPARIAIVASLTGIGLTAGRLGGGALLDIVPARFVGAITFLAGALAIACLGLDLTRAFPVVAFGGLVLGSALGVEGDFTAFLVRRLFGLRAFGSLYGMVFAAYSLGSVAGVILCGVSFDAFHSYRVASIACMAALVFAALLVLTLSASPPEQRHR
jgi:OFA family oxalate/formate antiporter-like MFS transporter